MYCPNCGTKNNSKNKFCKKCGFNLAKYRQNQGPASHPTSHPTKHSVHRPTGPRPQRPTTQPPMMPNRRKNHKGCFLSILIVVILAVLVFGGIYTYSNGLYPFGNGPLSSLSQSSGGNSNQVIKDLWQKVNNKMNSNDSNNGSDDFTGDFDNESSNSAYHTLNDWTNLVNKSDDNNDIKVNSIKPYDIKGTGNGKYTYKVRYDFIVEDDNGGSHHHIQVFDWKSNLKNGKIASMNSPKQPEQDYQK